MSEYYKATSSKNPDRNNTEEVVLEKDKNGAPTKSVKVGGAPVELSQEEHEKATKYLNLRKVSDVEAEKKKYEATLPVQQPGEDVAGAGPLFASPGRRTVEAEPVQQEHPVEPIKTDGKGR